MPQFLPGRSYSFAGLLDSEALTLNLVDPIDLIEVNFVGLEVEDLRKTLAQAYRRPFGQHRLLWLRNAEVASQIQQNTLLKILEEPPSTLIIVLEAQNLGRLLPTVRSRLFSIASEKQAIATEAILPRNLAALATFLRSFTDRETLAKAVTQERSYQAQQFLAEPTESASERIKVLEKTLRRLGANTNLKLTVDSLLLHYPVDSGKP